MPGRSVKFVTGEFYHIYNRGIDKRPTFVTKKSLDRAKELIRFYRREGHTVRYSIYQLWNPQRQQHYETLLSHATPLVDVICYCLMPNHFHILVRQLVDGGISRFISRFENSYTKYFNIRMKRDGPLFLNQCKGVRIEDENQLLHLSRYIHINPSTSFIVRSFEDLYEYRWSSFREYIGRDKGFCQKEHILKNFKNTQSYERFIADQVDYQRKLAAISHLTLE